MSPSLFLIFNHTFTPEQETDARASLGVEGVISMPEEVAGVWGRIPPELPRISDFLSPVKSWLANAAKPGDYVLIQGDFGACRIMVDFAELMDLNPVYSTTRREAVEEVQADGTVRLTHHFRHVRFRRYGE